MKVHQALILSIVMIISGLTISHQNKRIVILEKQNAIITDFLVNQLDVNKHVIEFLHLSNPDYMVSSTQLLRLRKHVSKPIIEEEE